MEIPPTEIDRLTELAWFGAGLALTVALAMLVSRLFRTLLPRLASRTQTDLDDTLIPEMRVPAVLFALLLGTTASLHFLTLGAALPIVRKAGAVAAVSIAAFGAHRLVRVMLARYLDRLRRRSDGPVDDHLVVLVRKAAAVAIWSIALLLVVSNLGYDITSLVAGLGIGGLAVALAAKDTLANVFGGLVILTDKPFRIGDRVEFDTHAGIVEEIGVRSVRVRADDGAVVSVPNSKFVETVVRNVTRGGRRQVKFEVGLVYSLSAERLEEARALVVRTLAETPGVLADPAPGASLQSFGDSSVVLRAWCFTPAAWAEHVEVRNAVFVRV
jgi:MscS family membrane protein